MGDMADWHLEEMSYPCEWCGKVPLYEGHSNECEWSIGDDESSDEMNDSDNLASAVLSLLGLARRTQMRMGYMEVKTRCIEAQEFHDDDNCIHCLIQLSLIDIDETLGSIVMLEESRAKKRVG